MPDRPAEVVDPGPGIEPPAGALALQPLGATHRPGRGAPLLQVLQQRLPV
ncbi:MAG: hypothetical protein ACRDZ1_18505 [Acidimicrobiia bacterium]